MNEELQAKIIENNKKMSELLRENEKIIIGEGYNPPVKNYALANQKERINFPNGYVRVNEVFQRKYHLGDIVKEAATIKNLAYSLQLSDFYNFVFNRFYVWGSLESMMCKSAVINLVSIFEALIFECANNICSPATCKSTLSCERHFSKKQRNNSFEALSKINSLYITDFTETEMKRISEIIDFRNRVHIRLSEGNEFLCSDFTISLHNEIIGLLQRLADNIYCNGVPLYNKCN